jgi:serine/threonine protein kinase
LAAGEGRKEIVELLCKAGADVNVEDRWGNRPLDDAVNAKKNSKEVVKLLHEYGARSMKNPSAGQQEGQQHQDDSSLSMHPTIAVRKKPPKKDKEEETSNSTGTLAYLAPELFYAGAVPTPASDMWAAGVIMFVLLTGT